MTGPTFTAETDAELAALGAVLPDASPAEAADAVMAFLNRRAPWRDLKRLTDTAILHLTEATIARFDASASEPETMTRSADLFEEALTAAGKALLLAVHELADMQEVQRETLIELGRARAAAHFYADRAHSLEVVLQEQTGIDIRDHMARA